MKKIIVVGSFNMDIIINVPHIPVEGETILAKSVAYASGGKGANQALSIAKLGGNVQMLGCLGDDTYGSTIMGELQKHNINTSSVHVDIKEPTGVAYINVSEKGANNIVVNMGANSQVTPDLLEKYASAFDDAEYCIAQLEIPLETVYSLSEICNEKNIKFILNPAPAVNLDFNRLKNVYIIAPNESELDILITGTEPVEKKAEMLYQKGFQNVLVTVGEKGALLYNEHGLKKYEAFRELKVVDTTAAGDSFIGSFVFGLSAGMDFNEALSMASIAAAITVSGKGAQPSLPTFDQVKNIFGSR